MIPFGAEVLRADADPGGGVVYVLRGRPGDVVVAPFDGALREAVPLGNPIHNNFALTFIREDGVEFIITNVIMDDPNAGLKDPSEKEPANRRWRWLYVTKTQRIGVLGNSNTLISAYGPLRNAMETHGQKLDPKLVLQDLALKPPPAAVRQSPVVNRQPILYAPPRHDGNEFGVLILAVIALMGHDKKPSRRRR